METTMTDHPNLQIEQDGRLLRLTLARPDCGVSDSMAAAVSAALAAAHETSDAVLLRSAGPDFCTGRVRDVARRRPRPTPAVTSTTRSSAAIRPCAAPRCR
jgi:enoyl-CoA hydratase